MAGRIQAPGAGRRPAAIRRHSAAGRALLHAGRCAAPWRVLYRHIAARCAPNLITPRVARLTVALKIFFFCLCVAEKSRSGLKAAALPARGARVAAGACRVGSAFQATS